MNSREAFVDNDRILLTFPYSAGIIARIKEELPDYKWDGKRKVWHLPASPFHAKKVRAFANEYGFRLDISVSKLANQGPELDIKNIDIFDEKLKPYQKECVAFLISNKGRAIIADEMGLGKTIETMAYLKHEDVSNVLVISPANVVYKWKFEIDKWLGWQNKVLSATKDSLDPDARIHICSYAIAVNKLKDLKSHRFAAIILDECHYISNEKTARTRAIQQLVWGVPILIGLSGTPFLNRPIEMFSMLSLLDYISYPNKFQYAKRYCDAHETYFGWDYNGHSNEEELRERVKDLMIRRTKKELKDQLPNLQRIVHLIGTDDKEYRKVVKAAKLKGETEALLVVYKYMGMCKVKPTIDLIDDMMMDPEQKVVVYAHHKDVVSALTQELSKRYKVSQITGDVDKKERQHRSHLFQTTDTIQIMIISEAGGEGIDLYEADKIVFAERSWNPGREMQAESRCHRLGQKNAVSAYYIVMKDTIDEEHHRLIESKRVVFDSIVESDVVETSIINGLSSYLKKETIINV